MFFPLHVVAEIAHKLVVVVVVGQLFLLLLSYQWLCPLSLYFSHSYYAPSSRISSSSCSCCRSSRSCSCYSCCCGFSVTLPCGGSHCCRRCFCWHGLVVLSPLLISVATFMMLLLWCWFWFWFWLLLFSRSVFFSICCSRLAAPR